MKVEKVSKNQLLSNSIWKFLESIGSSGVQMLITVILARLLSPHDYGLMAIVLVAITFLALFINSGISSYLVYIKDIRKQDFFTALIINIGASLLLMLLLILCSGFIAAYYNASELKPLITVMSVTLPFNAIASVYNAYAMKLSMFKTLFIRNMIALPISGVIALIMAYTGFGVWALVVQQISSSLLLALVLVVSIRIKIDGEWFFNKSIAKPMLQFGGYTLLTTIIAFISDNISDLLIGKKISAKQLGYYNRGCHFPGAFANIFNGILVGVFFPAFASYNSNLVELKEKCRKTIRLLCYLVFPLFLCMIASTKPLVLLVLTEKWSASIVIMQIICVYFCMMPFLQTFSQIYLATGHVKLRTIGEIVKMVLTVPLLFLIVDYGIIAVALARVFVNLTLVFYSMIINKIVLKYSFYEFLTDIIKPLFLSLVMFGGIYLITMLGLNNIITLFLQGVFAISFYFISVRVFKIEEVSEMIFMIKDRIKNHKKQ